MSLFECDECGFTMRGATMTPDPVDQPEKTRPTWNELNTHYTEAVALIAQRTEQMAAQAETLRRLEAEQVEDHAAQARLRNDLIEQRNAEAARVAGLVETLRGLQSYGVPSAGGWPEISLVRKAAVDAALAVFAQGGAVALNLPPSTTAGAELEGSAGKPPAGSASLSATSDGTTAAIPCGHGWHFGVPCKEAIKRVSAVAPPAEPPKIATCPDGHGPMRRVETPYPHFVCDAITDHNNPHRCGVERRTTDDGEVAK